MHLARLRQPAAPRLHPFDAEVGRLPVVDVDLQEHQRREALLAGLALLDVDPGQPLPPGTRALCTPDAVFTAAALLALLEEGREGLVAAAVRRGTPLWCAAAPFAGPPDQDLVLPLWAGDLAGVIPGPGGAEQGARPAFCLDEQAHDLARVDPLGPAPHRLAIPHGPRLAFRYAHWLHGLNLGLALLAALRRRLGAVGGRNVVRGKVRRHPRSLVEGSILEAGARIENGATVIDSYVGAGVHVADHAIVVGCVLGAGCQTLVDTHLRRVVAHGGSTLSNLGLSDVVIGRECFVTSAVTFFAGAPGRTVTVDGVDTHRPVLGGAVGRNCLLGARALFSAGQAVPPGAVVVMRPDEGAARLDDAGLARASMHHGDRTRDM